MKNRSFAPDFGDALSTAGCLANASVPTPSQSRAMRASRLLLGLALLFCQAAFGLAQLSAIPHCGQTCLLQTLTVQNECPLTNQTCICANKHIAANVTACVTKDCSKRDALTYANVSKATCGVVDPDRTGLVIWPAGTLAVFATIMVVLRIWARVIASAFWWDDAVILATWAVLIPFTVLGIFMGINGLGKHVWDIPFHKLETLLKIYYFDETLYMVVSAGYKIGLLLFLLRIFPDERFRKITWCLICFNVAWGISSVCMTIFQCTPIRKAWDWEGVVKGHCNNIHVQAWVAAGMSILLDTIILVLPLRELTKLQLNKKKKFGLMAVFGVGIFITCVSCVRLQTLVQFGTSNDMTWDGIPATYWTAIEVNTGVICACMPATHHLLKSFFPHLLGSIFSSNKESGQSSKSSQTIGRIRQRAGAQKMYDSQGGGVSPHTQDVRSTKWGEDTILELERLDARQTPHSELQQDFWDANSTKGILDRSNNHAV